jgi:hypothetical protein
MYASSSENCGPPAEMVRTAIANNEIATIQATSIFEIFCVIWLTLCKIFYPIHKEAFLLTNQFSSLPL